MQHATIRPRDVSRWKLWAMGLLMAAMVAGAIYYGCVIAEAL